MKRLQSKKWTIPTTLTEFDFAVMTETLFPFMAHNILKHGTRNGHPLKEYKKLKDLRGHFLLYIEENNDFTTEQKLEIYRYLTLGLS